MAGQAADAKRRSSRICRSSTRTIISGTRRSAAAICCRNCSRTSAEATTSSRPCFLNAARCTGRTARAEMAPVGEVEFVNGISAMSASGGYGPCRVAEAIVGHADLTLGARVREVLEAEIAVGGGRFRGIRHGVSWDEHDAVRNSPRASCRRIWCCDPKFREGFAQLAPLGLSFKSWQYHPQLPDAHRPRPRLPRHHDHPQPCRRGARRRPLQRPPAGDPRRLEEGHRRTGQDARTSTSNWAASA